ncbi:asparagine synthase (glutamine-hydrolyzing) [bacterium]|jgi:asparagine synthase (glutamine-hydrolysing)|nr:asparagine synthase (glutamine-hydrolyzing) [bacterium]
MCGIAGYYNLTKEKFEINENLLYKMQQAMVHRGPDGSGVWLSNKDQVGFAHRRLSIIDLSDAGKQPMIDPEKTVAVCYNGEIYNHEAIRLELEKKGYSYRSRTDTETILYAYKEWGIDCIQKFDGMFAIAIFDLQKKELYLVRDRIGIKPLYFSMNEGVLSFASEIKSLWQLPWIDKKISNRGLHHYLTFMVTPAPMTLYDGVYKLPSGFLAKVDANKNVSFKEWYNPLKAVGDYDEKEFSDEKFCIDNIRNLLRDSIEKRMMSDVPYGVFLSGGIDSSLNVALMTELTDNVKTFNVSFSDGPELSETEWARKVAKRFGTEHHEIVISEKEAFDFFEKMAYHQDEPISDCVCVPLYYVSKLLKDSGVTVVQVGEGSDELYCGYSTYAQYIDTYNRYWRPAEKLLPSFVKKLAYSSLSKIYPSTSHRLSFVKNLAENRGLFWGGAIAFSELSKESLLNDLSCEFDPVVAMIYPDLRQDLDSFNIVDFHMDNFRKYSGKSDFLNGMIYLELKQRLPELLLMRVDKMAMATSVEGRVPFLDHKHVEFALKVSPSLKYKDGITKYILKKAAEGILPNDVIYRKKMGFAAPTTRWFKQGKMFKSYFLSLLDDKKDVCENYFDTKQIRNMFETNLQPNQEYSLQLWVLQNLMVMM